MPGLQTQGHETQHFDTGRRRWIEYKYRPSTALAKMLRDGRQHSMTADGSPKEDTKQRHSHHLKQLDDPGRELCKQHD
jgi:hypothetical protein